MLFQTGWFLVSLLTQMGVITVLRTAKVPLFQSRPSLPITLSILTLVLVGLMLTLIPKISIFGSLVTSGHPEVIGYAISIALGYCLTAQLGKVCYKRAFHEWL
ncbi:MAG: hypothetical protein K2M43_01885 [Mycoplasmoidaceae bacterium]|nr:hypothetical protein [Mycoplasmoidaceae bacterium]